MEVQGISKQQIHEIYIIWTLKLLKDTKHFKCLLKRDFRERQEGYDNVLVYITDSPKIPEKILTQNKTVVVQLFNNVKKEKLSDIEVLAKSGVLTTF